MSGMVTRWGLGNCERVCQARRVESLDGNGQALEQESCFSRISRRIRQVPSDLCQEFLALTLMGPSVSMATGKKSWVPLRELYLVVFLAAAVSAAMALEIGVAQSVCLSVYLFQ